MAILGDYSEDEWLRLSWQALDAARQVDSLLEVSESREVYLANLKSIIGEDTVNLTLTPEQPGDVVTNTDQINLMSKSAIDLEFRKEFEGMGIEDLSNQSTAQSQMTELFFFSPIQGVVS